MEALEVTPAGIRLSDWIEAAPIGKTATYELLKILGINPSKLKLPGLSTLVSVLTEQEAQQMDAAASAIAAGRSIAEIAGALATSPRTTATAHGQQTPAELGPEALGPDLLLARLEAGERALRSGLPLTTTEVSWILGARPGSATVTRGRIVATRHGRNVWSLSRLEG